MGKSKKRMSALNIILVLQLFFMFMLSLGITYIISKSATDSSINYITTITEERSQIILNYVENAERILSAYSRADEILDIIENPESIDAVNAAQKYTEAFSEDIVNLEGIYVSDWNTHVLAHTNRQTVGITTRHGVALQQLRSSLLDSGDKVYDTGIIISPASGKQIVSMYKAVYNSLGKPVGLVGLGVYTSGLVNTLNSLGKRDMENSFYSMVNVSDKKYIFNNDFNKISMNVDNSALIKLCDSLDDITENRTGYFNYTVENKKYISVYSYIGEKGWLFMVDDTEDEIFALTKNMRIYMIIFCVFCIAIIFVFNISGKIHRDTAKKLTSAVQKNEKVKESLNTAVFNDVLTDVRNRVSFSNDFEPGKVKNSEDYPYYFAMFNIMDFSRINIMFGEENGDMILVSTVDALRECFDNSEIYRTGSDEFIVAVPLSKNDVGYSVLMKNIDKALGMLSSPYETEQGNFSVMYKVSAARKSKNIDSSVLSSLKNILNQSQPAASGQIPFIDLDKF